MKILENVFIIILILFLFWFLLSYIDINLKNDPFIIRELAKWNMFRMFLK